MNIPIEGLASACTRWHVVSDAYAFQLTALAQGKPGALAQLRLLRRRLDECRIAVDALMVE